MTKIKYRKLSHSIYHCNYHIVWTPKYRYRLLKGIVADFVEDKIRQISEWKEVEIIELNIQKDHVHMVCSIPPKLSISTYMGIMKGKSAMAIFKGFPSLKLKLYWGNHFWAPGYCVDTVGLDAEKIRKYVKYQENKERQEKQLTLKFK